MAPASGVMRSRARASPILPSEIWIKLGIGPRKSSNVCILTAALVERKSAHGNSERHKSIVLKSPCFCLRSQAENWHVLHVLPLGDEFREGIAFCGTHEKFGKCLAERFCHDKLRWRDVGTNGAQPRPEGTPKKLGGGDGEILEQSLGDNASLDEGMVGAHFAFDTVAVVGRFAMEVLIAVVVAQRDHVFHPEMV